MIERKYTSNFDLQAAMNLDRELTREIIEGYRARIESGRKWAERVKVRAAELNSLGIFPQESVIEFDDKQDGETTESMQSLIVVSSDKVNHKLQDNGYAHKGSSVVVNSDGEISHRTTYEKDGGTFYYIVGVAVPEGELYKICPDVLDAIYNINRKVLPTQYVNPRQAGEFNLTG